MTADLAAELLRRAKLDAKSASVRLGVVTAIDAPSASLSVDLAGAVVSSVRWISTYTPSVGDFVVLVLADSAWVVLGELSRDLTDPAGTLVSTQTLTNYASFHGLQPQGSPSWFWFADSVLAQGLSGSMDVHAGVCLFSPLSEIIPPGATVLAAKLRLTRWADDSGAAPKSPVVRLHAYTGSPSGQPTWIGAAWRPGTVAVGQSATWDLPSGWLTQLVAGTARGVGLHSASAADYALWLSTAQLTVTYSVSV